MTPCMEFEGPCHERGYGRIWVGDKYVSAHRFSYCVANGVSLESIEHLVVRHICDNPRCYKPTHLVIGTQEENMNDMMSRKRQCRGERNGKARLSEEEVKEILKIYKPRDPVFGAKPLAERFNIHPTAIAKIGRGERWKYLKK